MLRPFDVRFGSFIAYAPRGTTPEALHAKAFMRSLKNAAGVMLHDGKTIPMINYLCGEIASSLGQYRDLSEVLNPASTLIPAPGSSLRVAGGLWVPELIRTQLVANGIGRLVLPCLGRVKPVRKSATAPMGQRPEAQDHYDTIAVVEQPMVWPRHLIVVDDVITRGATTMGAIARLRESAPDSEIVVFAMLRTMSNAAEFKSLVDPVGGTISLSPFGSTHRSV